MIASRHDWKRALPMGALLSIAVTAAAFAQGSGSSRATPTPPRQQTPQEFAANLWRYINRDKSPYRQWAGIESTAPDSIDDPHGAGGKTYLNDLAEKDQQKLGYGAVLVREEYGDDAEKPIAISVMYRAKGTDPKNNDWYWLKFLPNGSLAKSAPDAGSRPVLGRVASCIECHQKSRGKDLVFLNDARTDGK
jgi:hypothetical protein